MDQLPIRKSPIEQQAKKVSGSRSTSNQDLHILVTNNHLPRYATIPRWQAGYKIPPRITHPAADDGQGNSALVKSIQYPLAEEDDDTKLRLLYEKARRVCVRQIGGLRTDPFNALPIESSGQVPMTFDFLAQYWAHIDMADMRRGSDGRPILYSVYFSALLHNPMLFEVMMAFCMLMQSLQRGALPKLSPEALRHTSNCVAMLREKILSSEDDATGDMVICTIVVLGAVAIITHDFKSLKSHITGMQRMIGLRGGYDQLGWDGYVATRCRQLEAGWQSIQKLNNEQQNSSAAATSDEDETSESSDDFVAPLTYPKHPFPPSLCARLALLPRGFSDAALRGQLSYRFISTIEDIVRWARRHSNHHSKPQQPVNGGSDKAACPSANSPSTLPALFLAVPGQTQTETLLSLAFLSFCVFMERELVGRMQPACTAALDFYAKDVMVDDGAVRMRELLKGDGEDVFLWAVLLLEATAEERSCLNAWARRVLDGDLLKGGGEGEGEEGAKGGDGKGHEKGKGRWSGDRRPGVERRRALDGLFFAIPSRNVE